MSYPWIKTFHILFVIAWMASVFYLPRILVNIAEVGDNALLRERLVLMGRRLYGFGHMMFGIMVLFGATLWLHFKIGGSWMHVKLSLVAILLFYYIATGRYLKRAAAGGKLPSSVFFRWYNEIPLLLAIPAIYLAVAKTLG
ncbi:MAG: CopD family protein [Rhodanobacteraceae bacterium]|nr:CopD family protein [Rhodanobacteraceae bacterium]